MVEPLYSGHIGTPLPLRDEVHCIIKNIVHYMEVACKCRIHVNYFHYHRRQDFAQLPGKNSHCEYLAVYMCIVLYLPQFLSKVTVTTPSRGIPYSGQLGPTEGKLARAVLGGNAASIAKAAMSVEGVREAVVQQLLGTLNTECSKLCRKKTTSSPSLFRRIPIEKLAEFKWDDMMTELEKEAPLLLKIMQCLVARNDWRNKSKVGVVRHPGICAAVGVMLKERNREMCGLQSLVSLLMYSCHCEKQVRISHICQPTQISSMVQTK